MPPFLIVREVQRVAESFREIACGCDAPVVEGHDSRFFSDHVLMNRDHVDSRVFRTFWSSPSRIAKSPSTSPHSRRMRPMPTSISCIRVVRPTTNLYTPSLY
jgi:hypothetical protein